MNVLTFARVKKMRTIIKHVAFLLLITCISCNKESRWDCIKRTGKSSTETRIVPPFSKIYLEDNIDVFITQGNTQEVKITTGSNLVSLVRTEVVNDELKIKNDNKCNWARSYKNGAISLYLTMPDLKYVLVDGPGKVKSLNQLSCDTLVVRTKSTGDIDLTINANITYPQMHSTGDITLRGKSAMVGVYHTGEGFLDCSGLQSDIAWTFAKTTGRESFNVSGSLSATITWTGDIYYSGNPATVNVKQIGTGKLIPVQ